MNELVEEPSMVVHNLTSVKSSSRKVLKICEWM